MMMGTLGVVLFVIIFFFFLPSLVLVTRLATDGRISVLLLSQMFCHG